MYCLSYEQRGAGGRYQNRGSRGDVRPVAQYGDQEFTGAEQAVADINAKGGIKGNKLQIVKYDDACDPKQAVAVANKVVNDGIKYVIGHLCSSSTQPASDIYEDEGILMITRQRLLRS